MSHDKIYLVAALGLTKSEMRFIKIMLALTSQASTNRAQGRYEFTEEVDKAEVVIVSADDTSIMAWNKLAEKQHPPTCLLVITADQAPATTYYLSRPFGPAKVLMVLDKIVSEFQTVGVVTGIFSGVVDADSKKMRAPAPVISGNARPRALVVDDSPTVRKQLVLELSSFNVEVDTAETGEQGLEAISNNHYDIIFLDVVMPGVDGYQVCKTIRRNKETKLTPIVMLTSKASPFDKVRGSLAGCSAYLTKPVEYENFYQVLEELLAKPKQIEPDNDQDAYVG